MAKDFSIVAKVLMNSAGFTSGKEKVSKEAKSLERAVEGSNNIIKSSFSNLTNTALPQLAGQFGQLGGVVSSVKGVFGNLVGAAKTVKTALISTGIGAVIIIITTAIAGLIGWMKRTDEGGDTMRKVFDVIKAVIQVVLTKITALGSAIVKVFKGDFKGAMEDAKEAVTGWGQAMRENIAVANQLNETQDRLEDYNETYALKRAQIEERISELQAKARDEATFTATERLDFTNKLKAANLELYDLQTGQKQLEITQLKQEIALGQDNQENRQKINDKEAEIIGLRTSYNQGLKETIKLTNKLADDSALLAQKEADRQSGITTKISGSGSADIKLPNVAGALSTNLAAMQDATKNIIDADSIAKQVDTITYLGLKFKNVMDEMQLNAQTTGQAIYTAFASGLDKLSGSLAQGADSFKEYATNVKNAIREAIGGFIAEGIAALVGNALKSAASTPYGFLMAAPLAAMAAGIAKTAFMSLIPSFATGGIMPNTGYALVGEQGPELLKMQAGTRIYNNSQTTQMLAGMGGKVIFELVGNKLIGSINNTNRGTNSFN